MSRGCIAPTDTSHVLLPLQPLMFCHTNYVQNLFTGVSPEKRSFQVCHLQRCTSKHVSHNSQLVARRKGRPTDCLSTLRFFERKTILAVHHLSRWRAPKRTMRSTEWVGFVVRSLHKEIDLNSKFQNDKVRKTSCLSLNHSFFFCANPTFNVVCHTGWLKI